MNGYDLRHVVLMADLEGDCPEEKLVSEDPDAPDVDFAVVGNVLDHLRGRIDRSPALGSTKDGRMHRPTKVTHFDQTLTRDTRTS